MTTLKSLLLASSLTVFLFSFSSVLAQNSPNLEMSNAKLESQQSSRFNPRFTAAKSGRDEDDYFPSETRPPRGIQERVIYPNGFIRAEVAARNTSAKTIKAVTWEYSFFSDAKMSQLLQSYRLYSKRKILAGETKALKGKVMTSIPTKTFATLISTPHQTVSPLRIEYTDGTVWEAH
jgi:hypothetical protein